MSAITDYSLGVQAVFNSKIEVPSLRNYDYVFTALAQSYQVYIGTKVVAKTLQAYNHSVATFPWYVRFLAITTVPFSICFEINRWSSDYQPRFWIKKTVHWICDHTGQFMYGTCIVSSVALAIIGKPGMLIGIAVTFSIDQIQNYDVLPAYYCHLVKTINTLASILFSRGAVSCWISVTELAGNLYFSKSTQKKPSTDEVTANIIIGKTIADVKNNPSHIHFKLKVKERKIEELLTIFKGITWHLKQTEKLLSKDNDWIKRADTSTDPISYVKNLRKHIEDACSDPKRLSSIELYLKVVIQYLSDLPQRYEKKEFILDVIAQLRKNSQEGINRLGEIAEECYEKIKSFSFEEQVLQLLYKRRKEIFKQFFDEELCEKTMIGSFKKIFYLWSKNAFDPHMGINFFLIDRTSSLIKTNIHVMCAAEEVDTKKYFCDQEGNNFYTPESIIDLLMSQLGPTLSWDSVNQWWQEQGILQDIDDIKNKTSSIQTAETHLKALYEIKKDDRHYCDFSFLKNTPTEKRSYFFNLIKEDCKEHFKELKEKVTVDENEEDFANTICSDIQQAMSVYPEIEKLLVSMLLKMGIFQLKT